MRRAARSMRTGMTVAAVGFFGVLGAGAREDSAIEAGSQVRAAASRPNVVVFFADDLGYGDLGSYGHPRIRTPRLDRLAAEGIRFTSFYSGAPVCSPSRAALLTGRVPQRDGVTDWIRPDSNVFLPASTPTIARLLRSAGYATAMAGKWHLNGTLTGTQPTPGDHGFERWIATQNNAAPSHAAPVNFVREGGAVGPLTGYSSGLIVDEALRWLATVDRDRPFFLYLPFHAPHEPVAAPPALVAEYDDVAEAERRIYYASVTELDAAVGRFLDGLAAAGRADRTLVLFTSDNGPETLRRYPGAARSFGSAGPLRAMKLHLHEGGIRVPGILRWPEAVAAGQVIDDGVSQLDLLPTICELAGVELPAGVALDGTSVAGLLRGGAVSRPQPLYWQYDVALGAPRVAVRDGRWKLLTDAALRPLELYDLSADIGETRNLLEREPETAARLAAALRRLHRTVNPSAP